jgi:hypothetical protein
MISADMNSVHGAITCSRQKCDLVAIEATANLKEVTLRRSPALLSVIHGAIICVRQSLDLVPLR